MSDDTRLDSRVEGEEEPQAGQQGVQAVGAPEVATAAAGGEVALEQASLWGDAWRQLRKSPLFIISAVLVLIFVLMAVAPQIFTRGDPYDCDISRSAQPPSREHIFGFDVQGCDYYTQVIYGARTSMSVGFLVVTVSVAIAILLGALAGFYGGIFDAIIARVADIVFALPLILGGIVILSALGERGLLQVSLVLVLLGWPTMMRLLRSQVLSVKNSDYVQAARALGAGAFRQLRVHILPNAIAPVIVYATITVGVTIGSEATLSFLGVGLQLPAISWGLMISAAQNRVTLQPHLLLFPAMFLSVLVLSFILMGDALRDALDPRLR